MTLQASAASYSSGRRALQLVLDGDGSAQELASLLAEEAKEVSSSRAREDDNWRDGCTALKVAACADHVDAIERLLKAGADPNAPVYFLGESVLEAAAAHGKLASVQTLLDHGADPNHSGEFSSSTPLIAAARAGHRDVCMALLQAGANLTALKDPDRNSAIKAAAENSDGALLEEFLKVGAETASPDREDPKELPQKRKHLGRFQKSIDSALVAAAGTGNMTIMQQLLDAGADVVANVYVDPWHCHVTAIQNAAANGHLEVINMLLHIASSQGKLDVDLITGALESAVDGGQVAAIKSLLQNGADATKINTTNAAAKGHLEALTHILKSGASAEPESRYREGTPLQAAAENGHFAVVELLLANGADVNAPAKKPHGSTALQLAAAGGHTTVAQRLIDAGADVNAPPISNFAETALQAAARTEGSAMLDLLMAAGATLDTTGMRNFPKKTTLSVAAEANKAELVSRLLAMMPLEDARQSAPVALLEAVKNHNTQIVRQLLHIHPDVNEHRNFSYYCTVLQMAAKNGDWEIVELLLAEKADVNLDPSGGHWNTALQCAAELGSMAAVKLLVAAGADLHVIGSTAPPLLLAIRHGHAEVFEYLLDAGADIHMTAYRGQTMLEAAEESGDASLLQRVQTVLGSRKPPEDEQPPEWGLGTLCETCQTNSLPDLFRRPRMESPFELHPSLVALKISARTGCPFCCFLWKHLGSNPITLPQPSPITFFRQDQPGTMTCQVTEALPKDVEYPEQLIIHFHFSIEPLGDYENPITGDTSSPETYRQIRTWLETCDNGHLNCQAPLGRAFLPTRLIYLGSHGDSAPKILGNTAFGPRLVSTDGMDPTKTRYIALSYRWPEYFPSEAKSTRDELTDRVNGLDTSKIPHEFNDAFEVAVKLGVDYIWIDSLCIIQDDLEDWNREAALMCQIYQNAYLTLAIAVPPAEGHCGLFRRGIPADLLPVTLSCNQKDDGSSPQKIVVMKDKLEVYEQSPLVKRGWCFQEREISRRIIHFTDTQVLWECRTLRASETLPAGVLADDEQWPARMLDKGLLGLEADVNLLWRRAVEDYSFRHLTQASDKLPALAGLAAAVKEYKIPECRYLAGMWEDDFATSLAWVSLPASRFDHGYIPPNKRYLEYIAPTWSWAAISGPVSYEILRPVSDNPANVLSSAHRRSSSASSGSDGSCDRSNNRGSSDGISAQPNIALGIQTGPANRFESARYAGLRYTGDDSDEEPALRILQIDVHTSAADVFGGLRCAVLRCTVGLVPVVQPTEGVVTITYGGHGQKEVLMTTNGDKVGGMFFDDEDDARNMEDGQVMFCAWLGLKGWDTDPSLVLTPTGNKENEFRRLGIIPTMARSCLAGAEIKEITII